MSDSVAESGGLSEQQVAGFHRAGYYVARGFYTAAQMDEVRQVFTAYAELGPDERMCDAGQLKLKDDPLSRYPRMIMPHRFPDTPVGPMALAYLLDTRLTAVVEQLIGETPVAAQSMFYFKPPGARGQDLHQDNTPLRVRPGTCLAAWIAVDDADEENGGMVVVPGSQDLEMLCAGETDLSRSFTHGRVEPPAGLSEKPMTLRSGDILFFNGSVIHGSYPNTSKTRYRRALINHYAPRSCDEIAELYHPLLDMAGNVVERGVAAGGGPCGETAV